MRGRKVKGLGGCIISHGSRTRQLPTKNSTEKQNGNENTPICSPLSRLATLLATLFFANSIHLKDLGRRISTRKCLQVSLKLITNVIKLVLIWIFVHVLSSRVIFQVRSAKLFKAMQLSFSISHSNIPFGVSLCFNDSMLAMTLTWRMDMADSSIY